MMFQLAIEWTEERVRSRTEFDKEKIESLEAELPRMHDEVKW